MSSRNLTTYLGQGKERQRRIDHLDWLARELYGDVFGARSKLVQDLADGRFDDAILEQAKREAAGQ